jgi:hypothetical protein
MTKKILSRTHQQIKILSQNLDLGANFRRITEMLIVIDKFEKKFGPNINKVVIFRALVFMYVAARAILKSRYHYIRMHVPFLVETNQCVPQGCQIFLGTKYQNGEEYTK